ncbi:hypothetical protein [Saccharopolyspora sp. NPDC002686]|uniref:hypothetical protein n=1 Tax=Saccharopolyspora sp. NPDC002686 TaxID=3154541 RepID=UPI00331F5E07
MNTSPDNGRTFLERLWPRVRLWRFREPWRWWPWGQRTLARIQELKPLLECAREQDGAQCSAKFCDTAESLIDKAEKAIKGARLRWWLLPLISPRFSAMDNALANTNKAHVLLVKALKAEELKARLPELAALVRSHLVKIDERRIDFERTMQERDDLSKVEKGRQTIVDALDAVYEIRMREIIRVRSFVRIVLIWTWGLLISAVLIAFVVHPEAKVSLCFPSYPKMPTPGQPAIPSGPVVQVCPTSGSPGSNGEPSTWDYPVVEAAGLFAAAITAAATMRQMQGAATAYNVPIALALLKLPTGALTAVLGLLLMRGQFVPGLTSLDTPGQIVAWAIVFGAAQQLFTRFVDERGTAVMQALPGPGSPHADPPHSGNPSPQQGQ